MARQTTANNEIKVTSDQANLLATGSNFTDGGLCFWLSHYLRW